MSKRSAVLLGTIVTVVYCPVCPAQSGSSATGSENSYAQSDNYRLQRADSTGSLRGPAGSGGANTAYPGSAAGGAADYGTPNTTYPSTGLRGPADSTFNNNAAPQYGAQYGTQPGPQYGNQYGMQSDQQYGAPQPAGGGSDGLSGGNPAPFSTAKVKGNTSAVGAVVGVPDRAAKSAVGATDKAAKTSVGVTGKAVKEIFKAITP